MTNGERPDRARQQQPDYPIGALPLVTPAASCRSSSPAEVRRRQPELRRLDGLECRLR